MFAANLRRTLISLVFLTGASLMAPAWSAVEDSRVEVTVKGMVCSFCAQGIEHNLRRLALAKLPLSKPAILASKKPEIPHSYGTRARRFPKSSKPSTG
jgi:hypothetical protein